jgi:hypothetical protein
MPPANVKLLPKTAHPLVIRTDFENQQVWTTIWRLIRTPVSVPGDTFHELVERLEDAAFRNCSLEDLLARVPGDYTHSFLIVADSTAMTPPDFPLLVIDLRADRGRTFRAVPSAIQSIENNLSIGNMAFSEFANAVDSRGIFRGFPSPWDAITRPAI